ncbi:MAG: hypothetical protein HMLKMBBP_01666 [Planctomycetes bacterium]|nr:hypothetical protein [Planctomycetota bacterium]
MTLEYVENPTERLLSIDPMTWGFGYAVIEYEPLRLVGWGTKTCNRKNDSSLLAVNRVLIEYQPTALVMPDWRETDHEFRGPALEAFIESIGEALTSPTLPVLLCTPDQVREHFAPRGVTTKHAVASSLAVEFPELRTILPNRRRNSQAERASMSVFDSLAAALATRDHSQI